MGISIRQAGRDDLAALAEVWHVVYRPDRPFEPAETESWTPEDSYLGHIDGRLAGAYSVEPMRLTRGEGTFRCGGIGSVAVLPEFRNAGLASQMMRWSLHDMRASGYQLAALYAYRDSFYRKFGYEVAGRRWQIKCPQNRLPRCEQTLECRMVPASDASILDAAYVPFARSLSGAHMRTAEDWSHRLGKKPPMIYAVGDPFEAYLWTRMEGGFWEPLTIGELAWSTRRGYESAMAVMAGLAANRSEVVWDEPSLSPFLASHMDQGVRIASSRHAQYRILDVEKALLSLVPEARGRFRMSVRDPEIAENQGPWQVEFDEGRIAVERCAEADLELDERSFVQAFLGEPSLDLLVQMGRATCADPEAMRAARRLLTPRATMLTEFF